MFRPGLFALLAVACVVPGGPAAATADTPWLRGDLDGDGWPDAIRLSSNSPGRLDVRHGGPDARPAQLESLGLPGPGTALALGDVNRRDGLPDILVGVSTSSGAKLLVYEGPGGALREEPLTFALPAPATSILVGPFDSSPYPDIAVACGRSLVLIQGTDRQLYRDTSRREEIQPAMHVLDMGAAISALGQASWTGDGRRQLVLRCGAAETLRYPLEPTPPGRTIWLADSVLLDATGERQGSLPLPVADSARRAGFTVDTTGDKPDKDINDGVCETDDHDCSLRAAIENVNAGHGSSISFASGMTISPSSSLPSISQAVTIDGTSAPGYMGTPVVQISGSAAGGTGISLGGAGSVLRGLSITGFSTSQVSVEGGGCTIEACYVGITPGGGAGGGSGAGITISGSGTRVGGTSPSARNIISGNTFGLNITGASTTVQGNYIGTNPDGTGAVANVFCGMIISSASNTIGGTESGARNVVSGNQGNLGAIHLSGTGAVNNLVQGNYVGMDVSGSGPLGNGNKGIWIFRGASSNTVGGTSPVAGNIVSNNVGGIYITPQGVPTENNVIAGNYVGTDDTGTGDFGNGADGVAVGGSHNMVGGSSAGARNIIANSGGSGVNLFRSTAAGGATFGDSNDVQGNYIGLDVTGQTAAPNGTGVSISSNLNTVGGTGAGEGNVIAGDNIHEFSIAAVPDGAGGYTGASQNTIQGNTIGYAADGETWRPCGFEVVLFSSSSGNLLGGTDAGAGNLIAASLDGHTVHVTGSGSANSILSNSIHADPASMGIELGYDGPTPNDCGDGDTGPNNYQNTPLVLAAVPVSSVVNLRGLIQGFANTAYHLEFYRNDACSDTGSGPGVTLTTTASVSTNGSGIGLFRVNVPAGGVTTITATHPGGDTSEFSACATAGDIHDQEFVDAVLGDSGGTDLNCDGVIDVADIVLAEIAIR